MNNEFDRDVENGMNKDWDEQAFLAKAKQELDDSCEHLDGHTRSRLNSIRHAALDQGRHPGRALLAPFGGLVTACLLVVVVTLFTPGQNEMPSPANQATQSPIEDLDILTSAESLDFFENLEFYQWLEENEASV